MADRRPDRLRVVGAQPLAAQPRDLGHQDREAGAREGVGERHQPRVVLARLDRARHQHEGGERRLARPVEIAQHLARPGAGKARAPRRGRARLEPARAAARGDIAQHARRLDDPGWRAAGEQQDRREQGRRAAGCGAAPSAAGHGVGHAPMMYTRRPAGSASGCSVLAIGLLTASGASRPGHRRGCLVDRSARANARPATTRVPLPQGGRKEADFGQWLIPSPSQGRACPRARTRGGSLSPERNSSRPLSAGGWPSRLVCAGVESRGS